MILLIGNFGWALIFGMLIFFTVISYLVICNEIRKKELSRVKSVGLRTLLEEQTRVSVTKAISFSVFSLIPIVQDVIFVYCIFALIHIEDVRLTAKRLEGEY